MNDPNQKELIALIATPTGPAVRGQIEDLVQALGLLEVAKAIVLKHHADKAAQQIVPVAAMPPGLHAVNGR